MDKRVAIVSANLGDFEKPFHHVGQTEDMHLYVINDTDFPPRSAAMTPRLQARIVKMFMWQFAPDYDYYIWIDSSCSISRPEFIEWMLEQLGESDIAVFKHPHRETVADEALYLKKRLAMGCPYITPRYKNEDISGQIEEVDPSAELYASTAFIYKNSHRVRRAMKEWWYHTSRYHSIDQLSLPWVIRDLEVSVIPDNYLKIPYLTYTRNKV